MKNLFIILIIILLVYSCDQTVVSKSVDEQENMVEQKDTLKDPEDNVIKTSGDYQVTDMTAYIPSYIINISASEDINEAGETAKKLEKEYVHTGFLWIPDFKSLSGTEKYVAFVGPYLYEVDCIMTLRNVKKSYPDAYAVQVSNEKDRREMYNAFDIRLNGKKQDLIFYYADPVEEEEYYKDGGEDWGWFINDISVFFSQKYESVFMTNAVDFIDQGTLNKLITELEISGFGYILVKGNKKHFIPHDIPESVAEQACEFFGYDYTGFGYGDMN